MKCPKCSYLGFETGDRCKNCGYDFSLLTAPPPPSIRICTFAYRRRPRELDTSWMDRLHSGVEELAEAHAMPEPLISDAAGTSAAASAPAVVRIHRSRCDPSFPLFAPASDKRRRTADQVARGSAPAARGAAHCRSRHGFARHRNPRRPTVQDSRSIWRGVVHRADTEGARHRPSRERRRGRERVESCSLRTPRGSLALTDHAILFGIDLVVLYSHAADGGADDGRVGGCCRRLPMLGVPPAAEAVVFRRVHGRMRADDRQDGRAHPRRRRRCHARSRTRDSTNADGRPCRLLAFGAGFIPALLDPDRRALHDRVARTRVVDLPSA